MSLDGSGNLYTLGTLTAGGGAIVGGNLTVDGVTYLGAGGGSYFDPNSAGNQVLNFASNEYILFQPGFGFAWNCTGAIAITAAAVSITTPSVVLSGAISGAGWAAGAGGLAVSGSFGGSTSGWQLAAGGPSSFSGGVNVGVNASGLDVLANRFIAASDARVKPVRHKISAADGIRYVMQVPGYLYQKEDGRGARTWEAGFLAQDALAADFPEMVLVSKDQDMPAARYDAEGPEGLRYEMIVGGQVAYLAAALRAALDMIATMGERLTALEGARP